MPGPHPAVASVRAAVRGHLPTSGRVLVACSGGADSLALAAAVAFEAPRAGVRAGLVTVDHGVQDGSGAIARRVAGLGADLGLDPDETVLVSVGREGGPEAAARTARYEALDAAAGALDADLLLGHTLDDQAETVLLGLGRGSGPRSIGGMRARSGRRVRPLLEVRRATTVAACEALGLPVWDDPHNRDPALQRARLRHEVLPLLEEVLQGGVAQALARTAALLRDDLDALDTLAAHSRAARRPDRVGTEGGDVEAAPLDVADVAGLPRALRTRVLRAWAQGCGARGPTAVHVAALDALVTDWHGQGAVDLPGLRVRRTSGRLEALPSSPWRP